MGWGRRRGDNKTLRLFQAVWGKAETNWVEVGASLQRPEWWLSWARSQSPSWRVTFLNRTASGCTIPYAGLLHMGAQITCMGECLVEKTQSSGGGGRVNE